MDSKAFNGNDLHITRQIYILRIYWRADILHQQEFQKRWNVLDFDIILACVRATFLKK